MAQPLPKAATPAPPAFRGGGPPKGFQSHTQEMLESPGLRPGLSSNVVLVRQLSNSTSTPLYRAIEAYHRLDLRKRPAEEQRARRTEPKRAKQLNQSELARLTERYCAGATVYQLAKEFGVHRSTVALRLKQAGVELRGQSPTDQQVDEMIQLYTQGLSLEKVGRRTGFDASTVMHCLRRRGIPTRDSHGRPK